MTIEQLNVYRGVCANVDSIKMQIDSLYVPVSSPNGKRIIGSSGFIPGNPTEQAVSRIIRLKEELNEQLTLQFNLLNEITEWLNEVADTDPEVAALIRFHYVIGLSWKETAVKAYGYNAGHSRARKRVFRYFGRVN